MGHYEARVTPVAGTDPATSLDETFQIVPGTYDFVARGDGYATTRFRFTLRPGQVRDLPVFLRRNLASGANGATATGDGGNLDKLIDDTESTNWAFIGNTDDAVQEEAVGRQVTVALDSSQVWEVRRIQRCSGHACPTPSHHHRRRSHGRRTPIRPRTGSRPSALSRSSCVGPRAQWTALRTPTSPPVLTAEDAFPSVVPRPRAPELTIRSFDIPRVEATHVRLVVLDNQCTGQEQFLGEQDQDPGTRPTASREAPRTTGPPSSRCSRGRGARGHPPRGRDHDLGPSAVLAAAGPRDSPTLVPWTGGSSAWRTNTA